MVSGAKGTLEGDLRNAVAVDDLFDPSRLVTQSGVKQGQANPTNATLAAALQNRDQNRKRDNNRGLGTQGAF
jgi:hypothetical protein